MGKLAVLLIVVVCLLISVDIHLGKRLTLMGKLAVLRLLAVLSDQQGF